MYRIVDIAEIRTPKFQVQRMGIDEEVLGNRWTPSYQKRKDRFRAGARAEERRRGRAITNAGLDIEDFRREPVRIHRTRSDLSERTAGQFEGLKPEMQKSRRSSSKSPGSAPEGRWFQRNEGQVGTILGFAFVSGLPAVFRWVQELEEASKWNRNDRRSMAQPNTGTRIIISSESSSSAALALTLESTAPPSFLSSLCGVCVASLNLIARRSRIRSGMPASKRAQQSRHSAQLRRRQPRPHIHIDYGPRRIGPATPASKLPRFLQSPA
ncbi:hypothetical protein C8R44DRAFT_858385 [Mycena epipterygia]|nr:hypothetical protein C8R44DRAFT_858385 [Mycena epipterygia]